MHHSANIVSLILCAAIFCGHSTSTGGRKHPELSHHIPAAERVDLNHASVGELLKVPGVTRTWAERIVHFRPYITRRDLLQEGILPPAVYNRIKDAVIVHREKN